MLEVSFLNMAMTQDWLRSLKREEVWPAFQPIVDIRSRSLAGFEILARWSDPEAGDISPHNSSRFSTGINSSILS